MRNTIFISYSHADKQWLDRFVKALRIGVLSESYSIWSDEQIGAGREWDPQIEASIASARIALLLVTSDSCTPLISAPGSFPRSSIETEEKVSTCNGCRLSPCRRRILRR